MAKKKIKDLTIAEICEQCKKGECVLAKMGILYCMDCNIHAQEEDLDKEVEVEENGK